jgi:hypothetical protein
MVMGTVTQPPHMPPANNLGAKRAWQQRQRMQKQRLRRVGLLLVACLLVYLGLQWVVQALWPTAPVLPGITDPNHALPTAEQTPLTQTINTLNHTLQGQTYVVIQHPLSRVPTVPLPYRGVWLAYDPETHETALALGHGLQQPVGSVGLLGTSVQPLAQEQLAFIAQQGMPPAPTVQLLLTTLAQTLVPQAGRSWVNTPPL